MFITIDNLRYSVILKGAGQPLICFHGFAENSSTWEFLQLNNCQMVLLDLIGHGDSEKPHSLEPYSLPVMLQHIHQLIEDLGFTTYSLLGYSMGGRLALAYALAYPQEVLRLILESSSYGECDPQNRVKRREHDVWMANSILENGIEWFNHYWSNLDLFASQIHLSSGVREKISERRLRNSPQALANTLRGTGQGIYPCLKEHISNLAIPVLYINGEYDEKYQGIGQEFTQLNPSIRREIIAGVGHNTHIENPKAFTEVVNTFLEMSPSPYKTKFVKLTN